MNDQITVLDEAFTDFPLGAFPFDPKHSAAGEYHYVPPAGYCGNWYDPIVYYGWLGPSWIVTNSNGRRWMEQTRPQAAIRSDLWPTLVSGEEQWTDYTLSVTLRPFSTRSHCGVLVRYQHSRRYYFCGLNDQRLVLIRRDQEEFDELASMPFPYDTDKPLQLTVTCKGSTLQASMNGEVLLTVKDESYDGGRIGLSARMPAQFTDVRVTMTTAEYDSWLLRQAAASERLEKQRAQYPQPRLWKRIDLHNFGTARQIRFGHLLGRDEKQLVLAQHQKRGHKDAYAFISCLTGITLEGEVLWQWGEPSTNPEMHLLTADLPFQVYDIDGDGYDEVIAVLDFKLTILDGRNGSVKGQIPVPLATEPDDSLHSVPFGEYAFDRVNADAIRIANLSGHDRPSDLVIKDRYSRLWAFNRELQPMWKFQGNNTGHFPFTCDVDGDGRDEVFVGYHLLDHDGSLIWTLPVPTDHTDEIIIGQWHPSHLEPHIAIVSGDEGLMIANLQGELLRKLMIGHGQRISIGNYRPELTGLQIAATTYWGNQGILYIMDYDGTILHQFEPGTNGNLITPVNWTGDGTDLILLNGSTAHGGLMNGRGERVVVFPNDGHPELCAEALDLTGDGRDELVLWDANAMFIYTQDRDAPPGHNYRPIKYPAYNASNYRGEYHFPPTSGGA